MLEQPLGKMSGKMLQPRHRSPIPVFASRNNVAKSPNPSVIDVKLVAETEGYI